MTAKNGVEGLEVAREFGPLKIDDKRKEVREYGEKKGLSRKEFELISLLASQPGKTFSPEEIIRSLWSAESLVNASDVRQVIYLLRKKVERDTGAPEIVLT